MVSAVLVSADCLRRCKLTAPPYLAARFACYFEEIHCWHHSTKFAGMTPPPTETSALATNGVVPSRLVLPKTQLPIPHRACRLKPDSRWLRSPSTNTTSSSLT